VRYEFAGEFRRERKAFVQPRSERCRGLAVAGIDRGKKQPEQRPADRLQGFDDTGAA
jgi:hypothetical protein